MPCPFRRFDDERQEELEGEAQYAPPPVIFSKRAAVVEAEPGAGVAVAEKEVIEARVREFIKETHRVLQQPVYTRKKPGVPDIPAVHPLGPLAPAIMMELPPQVPMRVPARVPHGAPVRAREIAMDSGVGIKESAWRENAADAVAGVPSALWGAAAIGVTAAVLGAKTGWSGAKIERAVVRDYARQMQLRPYGVGPKGVIGSGFRVYEAPRFRGGFRRKYRWNRWMEDWSRNSHTSDRFAIKDQPGELHPLLPPGVG